MGNLNPFHDEEFLKQLDSNRNRQVYVRIIALDLNENPLENIFGQVTSGNINIDGSSCVRRTCSLSMIANELNINEYLWGLKSKFKCEIGLYNTIDQEKYPEIIWFPQGVFYITSFNTSQNLTGWTVSITGKDKMCMLNGDLGGNITPISVNFGELTEIDNTGHQNKTKIHLKEIIKQAVHEYGKEPYYNIIIEDLDEAALELLEYRGTEDMYLLYDNMTDSVSNMNFNSQEWYYNKDKSSGGETGTIQTDELDSEEFKQQNGGLSGFDHRIELDFSGNNEPVHLYTSQSDAIAYNENYKTAMRIQTGETVGYRLTDLTYAGDLIGNCGESITSACLDKIKNMLGDYEYFYDLQGHFVWRRKPTYINISWNNIEQSNDNERHAESAAYTSAITYSFENSNLITAFTNTPNINDVKNDYSIFGSRKLSSGTEVPVHIRYAIDKKPTYYKSYSGQVFYSKDHLWPDGQIPNSEAVVNKDYFRKSYMPDFLLQDPYSPYDWWEAYDWAQYWSYLTTGSLDGGGVPTRGMSDYWTEYTKLDLNTLYNTTSWSNWENHNLFLYDVKYDNIYINGDGQEVGEGAHLGFTGHNPWIGAPDTYTYSCGHQYSYILSMRQQNTRIYFYKPSIPAEDLTPEAQERLDEIEGQTETDLLVDWREIIYQMAHDYMKHGQDDDFLEVIRHNNPISYPTGYTGYEQYYTDMMSFWRELYNGGGKQYPEFKVTYAPKSTFEAAPNKFYHFVNKPGYVDGKTANIPLYIQNIYGEWQPSPYTTPEEYNATPDAFFLPTAGGTYNNMTTYYTIQESNYITSADITEEEMPTKKHLIGWAKAIFEDPSKLNFWIDFLDTEGELSQFSVNRIGNRPLAQNDNNLKAVYYKEVPTTIFMKGTAGELAQKRAEKPGYTFILIKENQEYLFKISTQHQSCKDKLNQELYKHAICQENISITAIPIYYLEPNTRIFVTDKESGINGEYIVSKISYSLAYNGTMNITATKAANNLF